MLLTNETGTVLPQLGKAVCSRCQKNLAEILMNCYAEDAADILLCQFCAKQLVRKIMEDLCDLAGDRHG